LERVFLDANVLFSVAYRPAAGLARLWSLSGVALVTSDYALEEAVRNLALAEQHERLAMLLERAEVVAGTFELVPIPEQVLLPDDDLPILRAAIGTRCSVLLTGDLRHFGPYLGTRIGRTLVLRPAEYLAGRPR
jgi:uncharacterized protein